MRMGEKCNFQVRFLDCEVFMVRAMQGLHDHHRDAKERGLREQGSFSELSGSLGRLSFGSGRIICIIRWYQAHLITHQ